MVIKLRNMSNAEFERFYQWSIKHHANELMEELHITKEEAAKEAMAEIADMLPDGIDTPNNYLMTIIHTDSKESLGFIWTLHEEFDGHKQCFICDFAIWKSERQKGYATAALDLTEKNAAKASCRECILFVRDDNRAAIALYEKCGYTVLRQHGYGKFMAKRLS